jgi:hypothetical protein
MNDQLGAGCIIGTYEFINFETYFVSDIGVVLSQVHIVLYNLHNEQQSLSHFVSFVVYDDVMSNYTKIANFLLIVAGFFLQRIHEHTCVKHLRSIVPNCMILISS